METDATIKAIVEELRLLSNQVTFLAELIRSDTRKKAIFGEWIEEKEIIQLTGLSRSSLFVLYKNGRITKSTIAGKRNYYKASDFKKLLDRNQYQ